MDFEGEILKVYKDPVGLPTLGVGHLVTPAEKKDYPVGKKITRAESRSFLRRDLQRFEDTVNKSVHVPITQNQFDALVSLAFNIGEAGFKRSSVLRNLNNRKFDAAADSFLAWNKAGGKTLHGLTRRRQTERSVFLTPDPTSAAASQLTSTELNRKEPDDSSPAKIQPSPSDTVGEITAKKETETETGTETIEVTAKNEQDVNVPAVVVAPEPYLGLGFWGVIKRDLAAATGGNLSLSGISEYAQQASGWPPWIVGLISKIAVWALIATIGYFIFRVIHYVVDTHKKNVKTKIEADAATSTVRKDINWS